MSKTFQQWQDMAQRLSIEGRAFINGEFCDATGGHTFDCISPIDGRLLAKVANSQGADVDRAVSVARHSFNQGAWSRISPRERKAVLAMRCMPEL